jgi:hypothetical protein
VYWRHTIFLVISWVVGMDQADLSQLRTEFKKLTSDLASSRLRGTDLEDLKLPEDSELKLRLTKIDKFMGKVKAFLNSCDVFLQPLAGTSPIAAPLYGGLKCIVTVSRSLDSIPKCKHHVHR